jgi:hypothetical protein
MRIRGGPPAEIQEWIRCYNGEEKTETRDEAPSMTSLEDSAFLASIYGIDEIPLFGPQYGYGGFSKKRSPAILSESKESVAQEALPTAHGMASASVEVGCNSNTSSQMYGSCEILGFGPRYGVILPSSLQGDRFGSSSVSKNAVIVPTHELESLPSGGPSTKEKEIPKPVQAPLPAPRSQTNLLLFASCTVCTEEFSATIMAPTWISQNCLHPATVCCDCLARCIKIDLDSKIWNQIKCPECSILLIYDDIRRLADPETFSR